MFWSLGRFLVFLILGWSLLVHEYKISFFVGADNLYLEGYLNQNNLPGSLNDPRGIPNLPFGTEHNRLSDGISSTDPFETVSPNFPLYNGPLQDQSGRSQFFVEYLASAVLQGIAVEGAGDSQREDARMALVRAALNITGNITVTNPITGKPTTNYTYQGFGPAPSKNFTVNAAIKWNPSGFAIQEGETYHVFVPGIEVGFSPQYWIDGNIRANAEGYTSYYDAVSNCYAAVGKCRPYLRKKRRFPDGNWMSLVCSVGSFVRALGNVQPGHETEMNWLPLDESRLAEQTFYVGSDITFVSPYTGELICYANDAHNLYWNNQGSINVTTERVSWPPANVTYYQPLYLPACDSAIAAYANQAIGETIDGLKCNPNGGGAAWTPEQVSNQTHYSYASGAPNYLAHVPKGIVL